MEVDSSANGYRLPTEDQWEYACRARTTTAFAFGDDEDLLDRYAVYVKNAKRGPSAVGGKLCNAWGLFDMHGNVCEWCQDSADRERGSHLRMCRNGGWGQPALYCRSAFMKWEGPNDYSGIRGFRVATVPCAE